MAASKTNVNDVIEIYLPDGEKVETTLFALHEKKFGEEMNGFDVSFDTLFPGHNEMIRNMIKVGMQNIMNRNYPAETPREFTMKFALRPDANRMAVSVSKLSISVKVPNPNGAATTGKELIYPNIDQDGQLRHGASMKCPIQLEADL